MGPETVLVHLPWTQWYTIILLPLLSNTATGAWDVEDSVTYILPWLLNATPHGNRTPSITLTGQ